MAGTLVTQERNRKARIQAILFALDLNARTAFLQVKTAILANFNSLGVLIPNTLFHASDFMSLRMTSDDKITFTKALWDTKLDKANSFAAWQKLTLLFYALNYSGHCPYRTRPLVASLQTAAGRNAGTSVFFPETIQALTQLLMDFTVTSQTGYLKHQGFSSEIMRKNFRRHFDELKAHYQTLEEQSLQKQTWHKYILGLCELIIVANISPEMMMEDQNYLKQVYAMQFSSSSSSQYGTPLAAQGLYKTVAKSTATREEDPLLGGEENRCCILV